MFPLNENFEGTILKKWRILVTCFLICDKILALSLKDSLESCLVFNVRKYMSAIAAPLPDLNQAVWKANQSLLQHGYAVQVKNRVIVPKEPIHLQLYSLTDRSALPIGVVHLVHLVGKDWAGQPFENLARTTDEVAQAILNRVTLFSGAQNKGFHIDENGTIFDFNRLNVELFSNQTFSIDGIPVTYEGSPIRLANLTSEGIIEFKRLENGCIHLDDKVDKREGMQIFIDKEGDLHLA